jgi:hypothetical protein
VRLQRGTSQFAQDATATDVSGGGGGGGGGGGEANAQMISGFVVVGGKVLDGSAHGYVCDDVWLFDCDTMKWTLCAVDGARPAVWGHVATLVDAGSALVVLGGTAAISAADEPVRMFAQACSWSAMCRRRRVRVPDVQGRVTSCYLLTFGSR